ncbi:MAG TPA: ABC transporter ATP-binding protein [Sphingomicrobium sp.]|nr:ABC transporter ATP-binding protein [Sphingomicrobium sp.]
MDARPDRSRIEPADSRQEGLTAALRHLYGFMTPQRRRQFFRLLGLMLFGALAEIATIGAVIPFVALLASPDGLQRFAGLAGLFDLLGARSASQQLVAATILFMIAALFAAAVRLQLAWSTQSFVRQLGHEISVEIQRRILLQPYSFHIGRNSSEIIASLEKVQILVSGVLLQLMQASTAAFLALFIVAALVTIDAAIAAAAALALGVMYTLVSLLTHRRLAENSATLGAAYQQRVQIIQESLGGIRDVIIDNSQQVYLRAFEQVDRHFTWARASTAFIGSAPRFVIEAAGMVVIAGIALVMTGREGGLAMALPILGALALGAQRLLPLVQQLYQSWTNLSGHRAIAGQVLDLLRLPVDPNAAEPNLGPPLPFTALLTFERVGFTYPGRSRPALEEVDFTIPHGSSVALIGRTGSGKSTLADLMMGLLEPTTGRISIDGIALDEATRRAWQRSIAHVPQAIFLADASVARNIALGLPAQDIDMDRVRAAARTAQLDDDIAALPDGYGTSVGERGVRLSGGQRQRLGLARAIYKDAPVLVLDEATSALDGATETAVMSALEELRTQGRTIVIVAHRQSTVENCDLVARLENGRLVDFGETGAVLARQASSR